MEWRDFSEMFDTDKDVFRSRSYYDVDNALTFDIHNTITTEYRRISCTYYILHIYTKFPIVLDNLHHICVI